MGDSVDAGAATSALNAAVCFKWIGGERRFTMVTAAQLPKVPDPEPRVPQAHPKPPQTSPSSKKVQAARVESENDEERIRVFWVHYGNAVCDRLVELRKSLKETRGVSGWNLGLGSGRLRQSKAPPTRAEYKEER